MPRARRTRRPQNMGQNRNTQMRNNTRAARPMPFQQGAFQGGIGMNPGASPQQPGQPPAQNRQQCPPGQMPGRNPVNGAPICVPATSQQGPGPGLPRGGAGRGAGAGIPGGADRNKGYREGR